MSDQEQVAVRESVEQIVDAGDAQAAREYLQSLPAGETARAMSLLPPDRQTEFAALLDEEDAADLLEELPDVQAAQLIAQMPTEQAAHIVDLMPSNEQVDLLEQLSEVQTQAILDHMQPAEADNVRLLARYDNNTAGGLMITELLAFEENETVDDVLADLRGNAEKYAEYNVQYVYVVAGDRRLVGVLQLRDLLMSPPSKVIARLMIRDPLCVADSTILEELQHTFDRRPLFGLPVVDEDGRLQGVVRRADVEEAGEEQAGRTFLRFAGILGGEELRSLPLKSRCARRLSWLSINILLNVLAASVIAFYEETLSTVIALAVFLPIVSDMSGCSGNQAVAVSIRELVLGTIRPRDFWRVLRQEASLGIVNGVALGLLLGAVGFAWKGNIYLGLVVGAALAANTLVAVCMGSLIPLVLRGFKFDPALASGPLLTTMTDMCGFFLVLSFAQMMLPYLTV